MSFPVISIVNLAMDSFPVTIAQDVNFLQLGYFTKKIIILIRTECSQSCSLTMIGLTFQLKSDN
jgi:hypothetical protein